MVILSQEQLKRLDQLLETIPHGYAKAIILLINTFQKENEKLAAEAQAAKSEADAVAVEEVS